MIGAIINAGVTGLQKAPTRGPASLAQLRHEYAAAVRVYTSATSQNRSIGNPEFRRTSSPRTLPTSRPLRVDKLCGPQVRCCATQMAPGVGHLPDVVIRQAGNVAAHRDDARMRLPSSFWFIASDCLPMDLSRIEAIFVRLAARLNIRLAILLKRARPTENLAGLR